MTTKYITVQDFAKKVGLSRTTIYLMMKEGKLHFSKILRNKSMRKMIPYSELARLGYLS